MIDRIPVNILENGAIKYGIYDENGNLLRYEYIKNEDGAVTAGTALNKANLMSDTVAAAIKTATENANNPETISSALGLIAAKIGINGIRIAVGNYTGTGEQGYQHPTSILLPFTPKIVIIWRNADRAFIAYGKAKVMYGSSSYTILHLTWGADALGWYAEASSTPGQYQLNISGAVYDYLIIG